MTVYRLALYFPPAPVEGGDATLAAAGDTTFHVCHQHPGLEDHGRRWAVWERTNGIETTWAMPCPSFEAARDFAHMAAFRLVQARGRGEVPA